MMPGNIAFIYTKNCTAILALKERIIERARGAGKIGGLAGRQVVAVLDVRVERGKR